MLELYCWSFIFGAISTIILGNSHAVLIGASGAISGILRIAAAAGDIKAYYWLILPIVFAIVGSFTAHIGDFVAGVLLTKLLVIVEQNKRIKYLR